MTSSLTTRSSKYGSCSKSISKEDFGDLVSSGGGGGGEDGIRYCKWEFKRGVTAGRFCGRKIRKGCDEFCSLHTPRTMTSAGNSTVSAATPTVLSVVSKSSSRFSHLPKTRVEEKLEEKFEEDEEDRKLFPHAIRIYQDVIKGGFIDESNIPISKAKLYTKATYGYLPPTEKILECFVMSSNPPPSAFVPSKAPSIYSLKARDGDEFPPGEKAFDLSSSLMSKILFKNSVMRALFFTQSRDWWNDVFEGLYQSFVCMDLLTLRSDPEIRFSKNAGRKKALETYLETIKIMFENFTSMNFCFGDDETTTTSSSFSDFFTSHEKLFSAWRICYGMKISRNNTKIFPDKKSLYEFICETINNSEIKQQYREVYITLVCAIVMFLTYSITREDISLEEYVKIALCACCCLPEEYKSFFEGSFSCGKSFSRRGGVLPDHAFKFQFGELIYYCYDYHYHHFKDMKKLESKKEEESFHQQPKIRKWMDEMPIEFYKTFVEKDKDIIENASLMFFNNQCSSSIQMEEFMGLVILISFVYQSYKTFVYEEEVNNETEQETKEKILRLFLLLGEIETKTFIPRKPWKITKDFGLVDEYGSREFLFADGFVYKNIIEVEKILAKRILINTEKYIISNEQRRWEGVYANQIVFMFSFIERCLKHLDSILEQKLFKLHFELGINVLFVLSKFTLDSLLKNEEKDDEEDKHISKSQTLLHQHQGEEENHKQLNELTLKMFENQFENQHRDSSSSSSSQTTNAKLSSFFEKVAETFEEKDDVIIVIPRKKNENKKQNQKQQQHQNHSEDTKKDEMIKRHLQKSYYCIF